MSSEIDISVCIANFNGTAILPLCIESILAQTTSANIEIIVHDDFSQDNSIDLIKKQYPNIVLLTSDKNVGFCIANNRMAAIAKGKYLLFLNNDAELFPDAIDTLLFASTSTSIPTIYGLPQYLESTHELIDYGALVDVFFNAVPNKKSNRYDVAMVAGACLWVPHTIWDEIGGFPDWYESVAEDLYLCLRARLYGYPVIALPSSGFYHRVGSSFGGGRIDNHQLLTTYKRRALSERNKFFTLLVIVPDVWLWFVLPIQLIWLIVEGILLALLKQQWRILADIYIPLVVAVYRYRLQWTALRQQTQSNKRISFSQWLRVICWRPYKLQLLVKYGVPTIK